jgi:hypothetical protein
MPLHLAALSGHLECLKRLLQETGICVNEPQNGFLTPRYSITIFLINIGEASSQQVSHAKKTTMRCKKRQRALPHCAQATN